PMATRELHWKFFGEIHMLSHLLGASRSSDLGRVHDLEVTCAALDGTLAQFKHDHRALQKSHKKLEDELASQRTEGERSLRRRTLARGRIVALESATTATEREAHIAELERRLEDAQKRASSATSALSEAQTLLAEARAEKIAFADQVLELSKENA